jgi:hypothetical protein
MPGSRSQVVSVLPIEEQIQRRLKAIGFGTEQRQRLQRFAPLVSRVIGRIVVEDFDRAFTIHPQLRVSCGPVASELFALEAEHFKLLFDGAFDERYCASIERLSKLERIADVGPRPRVSIALTLFKEILLESRKASLLSPRRLAQDLYIVERILTYDINTAITLDQDAEAGEAERRETALDAAAVTLKERIGGLDATISGAVEQFMSTSNETSTATTFIKNKVESLAQASVLVRERSIQTAAATEQMSANIAEPSS